MLLMRHVTNVTCHQCDLLPMQHVTNATCYQCDVLPMQHVTNATCYQCNMSPMQHVTNATCHQLTWQQEHVVGEQAFSVLVMSVASTSHEKHDTKVQIE